MSRRESRVSINIRQNDALLEFENCEFMKPAGRNTCLTSLSQETIPARQQAHHKVPPHLSLSIQIVSFQSPPRLNSTLSVKIEELNAQISALNVENLRLRSSEIALSAQLRREKDKSRSIMADAEAAVRFPVLAQPYSSCPHINSLPDPSSIQSRTGYDTHEPIGFPTRIPQGPCWQTDPEIFHCPNRTIPATTQQLFPTFTSGRSPT